MRYIMMVIISIAFCLLSSTSVSDTLLCALYTLPLNLTIVLRKKHYCYFSFANEEAKAELANGYCVGK